jgi:hypothetical protein
MYVHRSFILLYGITYGAELNTMDLQFCIRFPPTKATSSPARLGFASLHANGQPLGSGSGWPRVKEGETAKTESHALPSITSRSQADRFANRRDQDHVCKQIDERLTLTSGTGAGQKHTVSRPHLSGTALDISGIPVAAAFFFFLSQGKFGQKSVSARSFKPGPSLDWLRHPPFPFLSPLSA